MGDAGRCLTFSLSSHNSYSNASEKKNPLLFLKLLFSSDTVSLFFLSSALFLSAWFWVLAASREQRAGGVRSKHRLLPLMLRAEWMWVLGCSKALPPTTLPPCPHPLSPPTLPSFPQPPAHSPAQLEGQSPPTPTHFLLESLIGFSACPSALGLPSPPSVLTPSLSGWLRALLGTRQPQPGLAEKRLSESQQSNQSLLRSVCAWVSSAEQSAYSLGRYGNRMPAQHCVYKLAITGLHVKIPRTFIRLCVHTGHRCLPHSLPPYFTRRHLRTRKSKVYVLNNVRLL